VAVAIGLDDRHDTGVAGSSVELGNVGADGIEVDAGLRA
jgi:hypothetical protein